MRDIAKRRAGKSDQRGITSIVKQDPRFRLGMEWLVLNVGSDSDLAHELKSMKHRCEASEDIAVAGQ